MGTQRTLSRRSALRLLAMAGVVLAARPLPALGVSEEDIERTEEQISSAKERYRALQKRLKKIASQYEKLSRKLARTLERIDKVRARIKKVEGQIEQTGAELEEKHDRLARRVRSVYKSGGNEMLSVVMMSTSIEELSSNIYYLDKITEADRLLIDDVKRLRAELEQRHAELEEHLAELQDLQEEQEEQLARMQEKQDEVQQVLDEVDEDVARLVAKRKDQLAELAREREAQRKAAEKAAAEKAAQEEKERAEAEEARRTQEQTEQEQREQEQREAEPEVTTGSASAVVASCRRTGSPGGGLCAMWVSMVFANAGFAYAGGNANDMYNWWTTSSNLADLKPGMIVAVSTHSHTYAGRIYGHIGIYIGDGIMMDNVGYIRTISVSEWLSYYSTTVAPRWGWLMGIELA